ncbi:MAG: glycosyltransferase family 39 protein [Bacteroidota bacterium]|nr:glycosyltransferase family 39 protein [Bacteroidota bacterium]
MSSFYFKLEDLLNNGKNFYKLYFFLVVFLCAVKFPSLLTTDIQPWDEGIHATRVLSIHSNGDLIDQSFHSVGKFYSASHPPLLIWLGYFITLIFGISSVALKLIAFVFSILCIFLIFLIGKSLFSQKTGFFAALIFCSNIIFNIFSKRFQLDIPYTFFILLSFFLLFLYNDSRKFTYLISSGIFFGCCLMTKILVGFFIPIVIFTAYFFIKEKVNFNLKDILILTAVGVTLAVPWHLYMIIEHGIGFTDYFFKFHVYDRALNGVEMNEKNSGIFFYFNFLLTLFPFSVLLLFSFIKDLINFKNLDWKKIFVWVWFFTGMLIITIIKTKLEVYVLLIIPPLCFLIPLLLNELDKESIMFKTVAVVFTFLNIIWFSIKFFNLDIKSYLSQPNKFIFILSLTIFISVLFIISKHLANKIGLKKSYYIFILFCFFAFSIYYAVRVNEGETDFKISKIKDLIEHNESKKIIYVSTNYRFNPQLSFYFKGLDLNWENPDYEFEMLDTKDGLETTRNKLSGLDTNNYFIMVEKDNINRANYPASESFIPDDFKLILKNEGYELYEN